MLLLRFPSLLPSSVPDLEEAVPGAGGNSHAVCRHPQAAHSVVVARKDSWGGGKKRAQKKKWGLGEMKVLTVLGTRVVGLYPHLCASRCLLPHDMVQSVHGYYQQRRRKTFAHGIEPPTVGLGKEQPSWGAQ